ncbi:hypothetical protein HDU67_007543 [Dinochytrium kinnereticum]|nr:hypothetical protein HDU67_007543 [Dinochytrium kinnereticum]
MRQDRPADPIPVDHQRLPAPSVAVFGAGLIGSYLGLSLALSNSSDETVDQSANPLVHLVGRQRLVEKVERLYVDMDAGGPGFGLTFRKSISEVEPVSARIPRRSIGCHGSLESLVEAMPERGPDFLVIALKRFDNAAAVDALRRMGFSVEGRRQKWCPRGSGEWYWRETTIVMYQNGAGAAAELRRKLGDGDKEGILRADSKVGDGEGKVEELDVLDGMWFFNVVEKEEGWFHQGSVGAVCLPDCEKARWLRDAMRRAWIDCRLMDDMESMVYGKVLINLNNGISALSGLPLKQEMYQYEYREVLARSQFETLDVYNATGINPVSSTTVPARLLPNFLLLPDCVYQSVADRVFAVNEKATSSMYEDIKAGRKTEIDFFQGEVSRLGRIHGIPTPICDRVTEIVKTVEGMAAGIVPHSGKEMMGER